MQRNFIGLCYSKSWARGPACQEQHKRHSQNWSCPRRHVPAGLHTNKTCTHIHARTHAMQISHFRAWSDSSTFRNGSQVQPCSADHRCPPEYLHRWCTNVGLRNCASPTTLQGPAPVCPLQLPMCWNQHRSLERGLGPTESASLGQHPGVLCATAGATRSASTVTPLTFMPSSLYLALLFVWWRAGHLHAALILWGHMQTIAFRSICIFHHSNVVSTHLKGAASCRHHPPNPLPSLLPPQMPCFYFGGARGWGAPNSKLNFQNPPAAGLQLLGCKNKQNKFIILHWAAQKWTNRTLAIHDRTIVHFLVLPGSLLSLQLHTFVNT